MFISLKLPDDTAKPIIASTPQMFINFCHENDLTLGTDRIIIARNVVTAQLFRGETMQVTLDFKTAHETSLWCANNIYGCSINADFCNFWQV